MNTVQFFKKVIQVLLLLLYSLLTCSAGLPSLRLLLWDQNWLKLKLLYPSHLDSYSSSFSLSNSQDLTQKLKEKDKDIIYPVILFHYQIKLDSNNLKKLIQLFSQTLTAKFSSHWEFASELCLLMGPITKLKNHLFSTLSSLESLISYSHSLQDSVSGVELVTFKWKIILHILNQAPWVWFLLLCQLLPSKAETPEHLDYSCSHCGSQESIQPSDSLKELWLISLIIQVAKDGNLHWQ